MSEKKPSGLEDVVVCESSICFIDGARGQLVYRGYDIDVLAEQSTFEEVMFLLWNGKLPNRAELADLKKHLAHAMTLPDHLMQVLRALPFDANPMRVLEIAVATLGTTDALADDMSEAANRTKALRLAAQLPLIVTTWAQLRLDSEPFTPHADKGLAWNFLYLLTGRDPDELAAKTFDAALILHADHELNASTFSARVTAATLSDMHSSVTSAIATLKGPLHGGANEQVMKMLEQIGEVGNVEAYMTDLLKQKKKVMGFGHRVYKAKDPRAKVLESMSQRLGEQMGDTKWFEISRRVEEIFQPTVASKGIFPNVDFYSASAYHVMGIPRDLFTPIFACSRVVGWCAHLLEQYAHNRLFRPDSDYVGAKGLTYVPVDER